MPCLLRKTGKRSRYQRVHRPRPQITTRCRSSRQLQVLSPCPDEDRQAVIRDYSGAPRTLPRCIQAAH
jgi:hypothetical protein